MDPSDSNSERRNLVLISSIFIIYHLAGGYFADGAVVIQIVNLKFKHPGVIKVLSLILLSWTAYRYWLCDGGGSAKDRARMYNEKSGLIVGSNIVYKYLEKRGCKELCTKEFPNIIPRMVDGLQLKGATIIHYALIDPTSYKGICPIDGEIGETHSIRIDSSFLGYCALISLYIKLFFSKPETNGFVVPYILFYVAVILSFIRLFL